LKRGEKLFGCGWLVFKDNENVYVMTSNSVLRVIECDQVDNALEILVFLHEGEPTNYDATVAKNDFVVVRSNEDSALDYAVLRLKTSRIVEELPLQVSKASPEAGDKVFVPDLDQSSIWRWKRFVQPYPEDLVDWLKSSGSSSSSSVPTPSCKSSTNFNNAKDLRQILIPFTCIMDDMPGLPVLKYPDRQIVAMCDSTVFIINGKKKEYFITFGVSMPRIIDDIRRKKPSEAKKWFPNYYD
jgi:hypothetical protein